MELTLVAHDIGGIGGMERVLSELIDGMLADGHRVTVISRACAVERHEQLRWVRVPGPARPFPLAYPWFFAVGSLLTRLYRRGTVVSTGAIIGNRVDWDAVHLCHHAVRGVGVSRTSRQTPSYRINAALSRWISRIGERFCYRAGRAQGLIAVSQGVASELAEHFPSMPVAVVSNGVSVEHFAPNPRLRLQTRLELGVAQDDLLALFIGSEWEGKGLAAAITALVHADDWRLIVVGRGDLGRFQALADAHGVLDRVQFVGPVEDPSPYYCASDAFVLPSVYETFSLVSYEAAASGLPLLVTPVSGVTELLVDGENGWFIDSDAAFIGSKLAQLGESRELRDKMGTAGRAAATRFTWPRMVNGYMHLFDAHDRQGPADGVASSDHLITAAQP